MEDGLPNDSDSSGSPFGDKATAEIAKQVGESYRDTSSRLIEKISDFVSAAFKPMQTRRMALAKAEEHKILLDARVREAEIDGRALAIRTSAMIDSQRMIDEFALQKSVQSLSKPDLLVDHAEYQSRSDFERLIVGAVERERANFQVDQENIEDIILLAARKIQDKGIDLPKTSDPPPAQLRAMINTMKGADDGVVREIWSTILANGLENGVFPGKKLIDSIQYLDRDSATYFENIAPLMLYCGRWSPILEESVFFVVPSGSLLAIETLINLDIIAPISDRNLAVGSIEIEVDRNASLTQSPSYRLTILGQELLFCIRPELTRFRNFTYTVRSNDWEAREIILMDIHDHWGKMMVENLATQVASYVEFNEEVTIKYFGFWIAFGAPIERSRTRGRITVKKVAQESFPSNSGAQIIDAVVQRAAELLNRR